MTSVLSPKLQTLTNLLSDGYIFHMSGEVNNANTGSQIIAHYSWVVDGCEVYLNSDNSVQYGSLHCLWGMDDIMTDGFYSFPIMYRDDNIQVQSPSSCFGVKMDF